MHISAPVVFALILLLVGQSIFFNGKTLQNITNIKRSRQVHEQKYLDSYYGGTTNHETTKLEIETTLHDGPASFYTTPEEVPEYANETASEILHWNDTEIHQKPPTSFYCG